MLKTGNGKRGSLKMVSESAHPHPPAGIIGLGLSVSTILLEIVDDDDELKFNDASTHGVILRLEGYTAL